MQWTNEKNGGFTSGTPWIDVPDNVAAINVEDAINDKQSVLYTYRRLIQLRHEYDIITYGSIEPLYMGHEQLFIYNRHYNEETWTVIANFSQKRVCLPEDLTVEGEIMVSNGELIDGKISGFGSIVIKRV